MKYFLPIKLIKYIDMDNKTFYVYDKYLKSIGDLDLQFFIDIGDIQKINISDTNWNKFTTPFDFIKHKMIYGNKIYYEHQDSTIESYIQMMI